jgi:phosphatidylinositol alpha-mannosyltransferase
VNQAFPVRTDGLPSVLFVATPAAMGGSNRSLVTLLRELDGRVHRVLASPGFGAFVEHVREEGLADEFVELPRRPGHTLDRLLRVTAGLWIAQWALRNRKRLAAIHANALTGLNLSTPAALITQRPTVVWIHDPVGSKWGARLGPILRRLLPRLRLAAVSPTAESIAVENGLCDEGDAVIVPNPLSADEILAPQPRDGAVPLHIGFVGGASPRKGFDLLPKVVASTMDLPIVWKLYVNLEPTVGNDMTWIALEQYPRDRVDPVGKLVDVKQVYADLDIVFIPSRAESFCRVAAEAMMNGIPVAGSDIPPLRALLGDDEAGLIFPTGDGGAAAETIRRLVEDGALRRKLGDEGRQRAEALAPSAIAAQLLRLYGL